MSGTSSNLIRDNIVKDAATGEIFIPATKRPDGTWRKPIKVKDGYVPQEEVPIYEPKGAQTAKAKQHEPKGIPGLVFVDDQKNQNKTKDGNKTNVNDLSKKVSEIKISSKITQAQIEEDMRQKQIRKLRKTLREIEQIEEKMNGAEKSQVDKGQLEKLKKKEATLQELKDLGETLEDF